MSCELEKEISHKNIDSKFKDTLIPCPLLVKDGAMKNFGTVCLACCIRINNILEVLKRPAFIGPNFPPDLIESAIEENKENIVNGLNQPLKELYKILPEISKKNWGDIARECHMCGVNADLNDGGNETLKGEPQPMNPTRT